MLRLYLYECHVCNTAYMYLALNLQNRICINTEIIVPSDQHITVHAVVLSCVHKYLPCQNKYAAWTQVAYQIYVLLVCEQMQANKRTYLHTCTMIFRLYTARIKKKVKGSHNRPSVSQRVPGGLGSQISMTFSTWRWWGCQPHAPAAFTPRKCSWYLFSLGAELTQGPWYGRKEYVTEKSSDITGNRSRDRPTSSAAP
jgi:hypothetical protein